MKSWLIPTGALEEWFPPGWIIDVPLDGLVEAFFETVERLPLQFALREGRIDRVTAIMTKAIPPESNQAVRFAKSIENHSNKVQIHHLAVATKIIDGFGFTLEKRSDNAGAMIVDMDPVAHVHPVAINWERLVAEGLNDHERN